MLCLIVISPQLEREIGFIGGWLGRGEHTKHTSYDLVYFIRGRRDHNAGTWVFNSSVIPTHSITLFFPGMYCKIKSTQKKKTHKNDVGGGVVLSIRNCDRDKYLQVIKLFTNYWQCLEVHVYVFSLQRSGYFQCLGFGFTWSY